MTKLLTLRNAGRLISAALFAMSIIALLISQEFPDWMKFLFAGCAILGLFYGAWAWFPQIEVKR